MIVDVEYYKNTFEGNLIPNEEVKKHLETATYYVHYLTSNRTLQFDNLSSMQKEMTRRAICHQAEHLYTRDDVSMLDVDSITSSGATVRYKSNETTRFSSHTRNILLRAGLRYAGFR